MGIVFDAILVKRDSKEVKALKESLQTLKNGDCLALFPEGTRNGLEKGEKGGEKLKETAGNKGLFFALLLFVGVPLPGTGAWTGTLAASFLKIDFKTSILAVTLGVLLAGIIMSLGSKFVAVLGWTGLLAIIAEIAIIIIASIMIRKRKN